MSARITFLPHGLHAQDAPRVQASLFAQPAVQGRALREAQCDHPEESRDWQQRLLGDAGYDEICRVCGEIAGTDSWWRKCRCGHDIYIHSLPGYGGCQFGDGCECQRFEDAS